MSADNNTQPEAEDFENVTEASLPEDTGSEQPDSPAETEQSTGNGQASKSEAELNELKDKYLRLYSEFDNYKRRTSKERLDLLKSANQEMIVALLPVLDDFDRARQAMENAQEVEAVKAGVDLIYNKLQSIMQQKGLKPMEAVGQPFDAELHEAITQIPAPDEALKGKVIDQVEKGYYLNDKVVRFAKVIIGA
ncbi:nucleotide exchange factor GrpE [Adhaeribacter radiodurans]|uniref:Protein GrpE n=1 Tax=Adhaeribacter radiodurans TaxID=2745197 RepID=A0A7L7L438_9BACT|nr:nucleotide exchange factor GrpE [Adhaeribacter radiodurans]QMU27581.1 nucleotide exchange factor GrpE [Adhaeribacter radiodurans]